MRRHLKALMFGLFGLAALVFSAGTLLWFFFPEALPLAMLEMARQAAGQRGLTIVIHDLRAKTPLCFQVKELTLMNGCLEPLSLRRLQATLDAGALLRGAGPRPGRGPARRPAPTGEALPPRRRRDEMKTHRCRRRVDSTKLWQRPSPRSRRSI